MPAKKGSRVAKSQKSTVKSTPAVEVYDENTVSSPLPNNITNAITTDLKKASKTVLQERAANNVQSEASKDEDQSTSKASAVKVKKSAKSSKTAKKTGRTAKTLDTDDHSLEASTSAKQLPEEQIQAFLQNYDLEAQARLSRLRSSLEMSVQSSMTRMRLTIERMPRAVRELTLAEFVDDYDADIHTFMGRAPVQRFEDGQKEWQDALQQSPAKKKRIQNTRTESERGSKSARRTNNTASASALTTAVKKTTSKRSAAATGIRAGPALSDAARNSSITAPSLPIFNPDIPKQPSQTPKPRMARPGELIQWQSVNGSPICGIIGPDGMIRPVLLASP